MPRLRTSDLEDVVAFLGDISEFGMDEPFPPEVLGRLGTLVPSFCVFFNERDRARRELIASTAWWADGSFEPGEDDEEPSVDEWVYVSDLPTSVFRRRTGYVDSLRLSDFYSRRQRLHHQVPFGEHYRYWGVVDYADIRLVSSSTYTLCIGLESRTRDFSERDRLVLDLVRPHLAARHRAVRLCRLLADATAALDALSESNRAPGVVLVGRRGEIEFASPTALRLLARYLGDGRTKLPATLDDWRSSGDPAAFVARGQRSRLVVNVVGPRRTTLLLTEEPLVSASLTSREWDVMRCVEAGLTNDQIAALLFVSPSTVKKHLEHVYAKLGVSTRTAALARLRPRLTGPPHSEEGARRPGPVQIL